LIKKLTNFELPVSAKSRNVFLRTPGNQISVSSVSCCEMFNHMAHDVLQELNGLHVGHIVNSFLNLYWLSVVPLYFEPLWRNCRTGLDHFTIQTSNMFPCCELYLTTDARTAIVSRQQDFRSHSSHLTLVLVSCEIAGWEGIRRLKKYCSKPIKL